VCVPPTLIIIAVGTHIRMDIRVIRIRRDVRMAARYEHAKGQHLLIKPAELDDLKLEAKHTINMERFVDRDEIDSRFYEKPYYLLPDGDAADEGYTVLRDALKKSGKVAIGQLVMGGREHLVGIAAIKMISCLRSCVMRMSYEIRSLTSRRSRQRLSRI
jgi:Ku protein